MHTSVIIVLFILKSQKLAATHSQYAGLQSACRQWINKAETSKTNESRVTYVFPIALSDNPLVVILSDTSGTTRGEQATEGATISVTSNTQVTILYKWEISDAQNISIFAIGR